MLTSQLVAVGEELGLQYDCSDWSIPDWERGLRRRLAWGLYMQDKWCALIHGRPSHINSKTWAVRHMSSDGFSESAADEDDEEGSAEVETGRVLYQRLIELSEIMAEILDLRNAEKRSQPPNVQSLDLQVQHLLEKVKPVSLRLSRAEESR